MSIARTVVSGLVAGAVGTLAMDLVWYVRYKRGGGEADFLRWEFASSIKSWDEAPAPAKVAKLFYEGFTGRELNVRFAPLANNVAHWGYGTNWGGTLAVAVGSPRYLRPWHGPLLGFLVWLSSYAVLPLPGIYKPIWSYDLNTLWQDLSAHLVFGTGVVTAFWKLGRR